MRSIFLALAALAAFTASPAAAAPLQIVEQGPALQPRTERFVVRSPRIDHDLLVEVTRPGVDLAPGAKLPGVIALDGGYNLAGPLATVLEAGRNAAPAFVVAVGYATPFGVAAGPRATDLAHDFRTMGRNGPQVGGGGAAFEAFLVEELRPLLERRYAIDPQRWVLAGHSQGAYFAATILAERPEAFSAYVLGSPPLRLQPTLGEKLKAGARRGGGRRVFVGYAPEDARVFGSDGFAALVAGPDSKLEVRTRVYEGHTHLSSYPSMMADGLAFTLPKEAAPKPQVRTPVSLPPEALARLTGTYRLARGMEAQITLADGKLQGRLFDRPFELKPVSEREVFLAGSDATGRFDLPRRGPARSVTLVDNGAEATLVRVSPPRATAPAGRARRPPAPAR